MPIDGCDLEATMAKGQKRTNRETRKPKQDKPKQQPASRSFLSSAERPVGTSPSGPKGSKR
jgi:hypothetical protein